MKTRIKNRTKSLLFLMLVLCAGGAQAQDKEAGLKAAIASRQLVFEPQTVLVTGGVARQIGGERYTVRISGDSLASYLPYFGRAYTAPLGNDGGITFTSVAFDYTVKNRKKGGWDVSIRPEEGDLRQFLLTVNTNGYATLQAISNNRQPISYNGQVRALH